MPVPGTVSKTRRFQEIMRILVRNELKTLVKEAAKGRLAPGGDGLPPQLPYRVRRILEELGPSFVKIGQLLGTRPDLVPMPFVEEFKKLYDETTPTPFASTKRLLEAELRKPLEQAFAYFEPEPMASASIGQVHRAQLPSGEWVAVKVQHPGIAERMRTDFEILKGIASFTEKVFAAAKVWQPAAHLREIEGMLERELDYRFEARNQERVHANFRGTPEVVVPRVFASHSTGRVLTMEFVEGRKLTQLSPEALADLDTSNVARIITRAMAKQVFIDRLFHADPSPGNILILDSRRVAFLDFGAVGTVTRRRAGHILHLMHGLGKGEAEETGRAIMDLCHVRGEVDAKRFQADVEKLLDLHEREHASVADPAVVQHILDIARVHDMLLPPDFMLITRALYQFEGICRAIDPGYELVEVLTPYAAKVQRDMALSPERQLELLQAATADYVSLARRLPHAVGAVLRKLERDEFTVRAKVQGLAEHHRHQRRVALRLAFTGMMAAVVIGLAIVLAAGGRVLSFLFLAGFLLLAWLLAMLLGGEGMRR